MDLSEVPMKDGKIDVTSLLEKLANGSDDERQMLNTMFVCLKQLGAEEFLPMASKGSNGSLTASNTSDSSSNRYDEIADQNDYTKLTVKDVMDEFEHYNSLDSWSETCELEEKRDEVILKTVRIWTKRTNRGDESVNALQCDPRMADLMLKELDHQAFRNQISRLLKYDRFNDTDSMTGIMR